MATPLKLTVVMTHPVQYYAPWFRYITTHCPEISLTVLYATQPTPEQQGVGFGRAFVWDTPLTEGYRYHVVRPARPEDNVHSEIFWGLDVPEIVTAILNSRPDVVLVGGWHSVTQLRALWACRRRGIPVLYRGDTHLGNAPAGWRRLAWKTRTWLLLRLFNGYLSVGQRSYQYLRRFGVSESRIFSTPHCVDNEFFASSAAPHQTDTGRAAARRYFERNSEDFIVLFVGKLESRKRPFDLIRAMAELGTGVSLLIVGTGQMEQGCRDEAEKLGVRTSWTGFLNQSELGRAYAAADCLAMPSEGETWGLVVNEALATGLPCVVSDRVGCVPDLITPGESGEVFPMGDISALAAALARVRERSQAGHNWTSACRARATAYSFEAATVGLLTACRAVAPRRVPRPIAGKEPSAPRVVACCGWMVRVSGLERMTFEVLRVLRARGVAVHCIVNTWENHRIVPLAEQIGASWSTGYYWYVFDRHTRNPIKLAQFAWDIIMTSVELLRDTWHFRATHILMPEFVSVLRNAPALAILRLLGVQVLLRLGNAPDPDPFYRQLWRWGVNPFVDHFVCNSRFTEHELLAHRIPQTKVSYIYNCVPSRTEPCVSDTMHNLNKLIYVGQIIPEKGLDLLLEALAMLLARGYDLQLDIVGEMSGCVSPRYEGYREQLLARANDADLAGRIRFLGWREDVPALLASAGIHCCPSRPEIREGFGIVNIEAKQAGVPSVVLPTGALPELITHGEDGWICSENSAEALAEGIEYFLVDPARLERASCAARASVEKFNRERFINAWWAIFGRHE